MLQDVVQRRWVEGTSRMQCSSSSSLVFGGFRFLYLDVQDDWYLVIGTTRLGPHDVVVLDLPIITKNIEDRMSFRVPRRWMMLHLCNLLIEEYSCFLEFFWSKKVSALSSHVTSDRLLYTSKIRDCNLVFQIIQKVGGPESLPSRGWAKSCTPCDIAAMYNSFNLSSWGGSASLSPEHHSVCAFA